MLLNTAQWQVNPESESILTSLGLMPWSPKATDTLAFVDESGAAYLAGIRQEDRILAINGAPYSDWAQLVELVQAHADKALRFEVERDGAALRFDVVPQGQLVDGKLIGKIGVAPGREAWPEAYRIHHQYGVVEALGKAADRTWELTTLTVKMIGKLFSGDVSMKSLSGPISIAQGAGARPLWLGVLPWLGSDQRQPRHHQFDPSACA